VKPYDKTWKTEMMRHTKSDIIDILGARLKGMGDEMKFPNEIWTWEDAYGDIEVYTAPSQGYMMGHYILFDLYEKLEKENERLRLLAAKESAKNFKYEAEG
jgi:hypothetical protein